MVADLDNSRRTLYGELHNITSRPSMVLSRASTEREHSSYTSAAGTRTRCDLVVCKAKGLNLTPSDWMRCQDKQVLVPPSRRSSA